MIQVLKKTNIIGFLTIVSKVVCNNFTYIWKLQKNLYHLSA